ncbi:MAG TPA: hypothetical protein VGV59_18130 [Pyrinomonadaceae bacterium]|nr:hypothetical protein [Pyrinomonadaceae bacterium]
MLITSTWGGALGFAQAEPTVMPEFFAPVAILLLGVGGVGWLVAAALGFARARALGQTTRWFALSAVCLFIYHLQWVGLVVFIGLRGFTRSVLVLAAFFNLFIAIGSICAIVGFARLTSVRPDASAD